MQKFMIFLLLHLAREKKEATAIDLRMRDSGKKPDQMGDGRSGKRNEWLFSMGFCLLYPWMDTESWSRSTLDGEVEVLGPRVAHHDFPIRRYRK
ncbi:hypothetical protein JTB14_027556 [Gonioctena quinquepunctata]|nr:hypothetical protein JTB14_027556 [Gonioctena quinquepunctata]